VSQGTNTVEHVATDAVTDLARSLRVQQKRDAKPFVATIAELYCDLRVREQPRELKNQARKKPRRKMHLGF
jgi:hypothetical protein